MALLLCIAPTKAQGDTSASLFCQDECHQEIIELIESGIPAEAATIASAANLDRIRWPEYRCGCESFEATVSELVAFMQERVRFLDW